MRYDVSAHPLLSEQAQQLDADNLEAQARVAEELLGLTDFPVYDAASDQYKTGTDAVALQVSYQVEMGMDAHIVSVLTRGGRTYAFRNAGRRRPALLHGMARRLAMRIRPMVEEPS